MTIESTVGDHAIPLAEYPHVRDTASVREVFASLQQKHESIEQFRGALVLDAKDRLVGMLGLRDLLHALLPDYLRLKPTHLEGAADDVDSLAMLWQEDCAEQCRKAAALTVRTSVTPIKVTVAASDPLTKAIFLFANHGTNVLPVTEGGRIVGVLRIVDVIDEVSAVILEGAAS